MSLSSASTSSQPGSRLPLNMAVISALAARAARDARAAYLGAALPPSLQLSGDVSANANVAGAVAAGVATALASAAPPHLASSLEGGVYADAIVAQAVNAGFVAALNVAASPPLAGVAYANGTVATTAPVVVAPPLRASTPAGEIEPAFSITYMRSLSSQFIDNLGDTLCFVGRNEGSLSSFLKHFGFGVMGLNISKQFDSDKPISSADHPKLVICAVVFVMLGFIGLMKPKSRLAEGLTGVAALCAFLSVLWIPLSIVPIEWKAVIVLLCGVVLCCLKKMTT